MTKTTPMSGQDQDLPGDEGDDREGGAHRERARVAHEDLGGVGVEPEEAEQGPDEEGAEDGQVRLGRAVEEGDDQERDEREDEGAAGQAVEAVGQVDPVAHGHDGEGREGDVDPRVDRDRADEGDGDGRDVVGVLDLPRREQGHDDLPQDLLAGPDPVAGAGVQPVVGEAEAADEGEGRQRREGRGVDQPEEERQRRSTTARIRAPPAVGVPAFVRWPSGPVDPDLLGEAGPADAAG